MIINSEKSLVKCISKVLMEQIIVFRIEQFKYAKPYQSEKKNFT